MAVSSMVVGLNTFAFALRFGKIALQCLTFQRKAKNRVDTTFSADPAMWETSLIFIYVSIDT